jgi:hypothetical protein
VPVSTTLTSPAGHQVVANFLLNGALWFSPAPFPGRDGLDLFSYGDPASGGLGVSGLTISMDFLLGADGQMVPGSRTILFEPASLRPVLSGKGGIRPNSLMYSLPLKLSGFAYNAAGLSAAATGATALHVLELESAALPVSSPPMAGSPPAATGTAPYTTSAPIYALEYDLSLGTLGSLSNLHGGISAKLYLGWGPSPLTPDDDAAAVLVQLPQLGGGYGSFQLQGILKLVFGDANLLHVDLDDGSTVYAILFNNIALSLFGFTFPPGVMTDFLLFAGSPQPGQASNNNNLGWFVSAQQAAS